MMDGSKLVKTEKELIIIPCCGIKNAGGELDFEAMPQRQLLDVLSEDDRMRLINARQEVANSRNIPSGRDLGLHNEDEIQYLPAYRRYSGKLYSQISHIAWQKLAKTMDLDMVIISALYGVIFWDEPIRNYNIAMSDDLRPGIRLKTWWRNQGLPIIVRSIIHGLAYSKVHLLLSNDYRETIFGFHDEILNDVEFPRYDFSRFRSGSNHHRGKKVNEIILEY